MLALGDSVNAIIDGLTGLNLVAALNDAVNIPAVTTDAFLNGYGPVDLLPLITTITGPIDPITIAPFTTVTVDSVDIALGGLLSPAGTIFNSVGAGVTIRVFGSPVSTLSLPANSAGPIGSLIARRRPHQAGSPELQGESWAEHVGHS